MTTRGKYDSIFNYREGRKKGYIIAKREFYNALSSIIHTHINAMESDILNWKVSFVNMKSKYSR